MPISQATEDLPTVTATPSYVLHQGRFFRVLATFDEHEVDRANAWMEQNEGSALLCIEDGTAYLAHVNDQGKPRRRMTCCICGGFAGYFAQHWNRDHGYGVCSPCVAGQRARGVDDSEIKSLYGIEGLNFEKAPA